jgi:hypothetical protein
VASRTARAYPAVYSLFQRNQWTTGLEIGFETLCAAVAAGLLILLIALTLSIVLYCYSLITQTSDQALP